MKKLILIIAILTSINMMGMAQEIVTDTISCENYANETFKGVFIEMSDYRQVNSAAKFIVTYEGDWPEEMRGAFEYAVKIWEEVVPITLPIKITAQLKPLRGNNVISNVSFLNYYLDGPFLDEYASPLSLIKRVLLLSNITNRSDRFSDKITDMDMLLKVPDMTISYNSNLISQYSFSLDGNPISNKYDFVTVALRDIAIGLGFGTDFVADTKNKTFRIPDSRPTYFESLILNAINSKDPQIAYANATKGSLRIQLLNEFGTPVNSLSVYAPTEWINGKSLHYLIPEDNKPISHLLSYDFGKGYIMRDLSGVNWEKVFDEALDWRLKMITSSLGSSGNSFTYSGTNQDRLPYKGSVELSFNSTNYSISGTTAENSTVQPQNMPQNITNSDTEYSSISDYCSLFNLYSPDGPSYHGLSLSVLKNDGTWDCVYTTPYYEQGVTINIENIKLNYDETYYARGTTGGLRYRLTKCERKEDALYGPFYLYTTKYFTRDFTPQSAKIKYSRVHPYDGPSLISNIRPQANDEYFIDVEIGLSDIEGTTRVVVEQLDEGERLPFQYEVEDFREGYFIANLDRELSTQLTIISYNENGSKRSNTITIPPIGYPETEITINRKGDLILIDGIADRRFDLDKISYTIHKFTDNNIYDRGIAEKRSIDISDIQAGMYILSIYDESEKIKDFKFIK